MALPWENDASHRVIDGVDHIEGAVGTASEGAVDANVLEDRSVGVGQRDERALVEANEVQHRQVGAKSLGVAVDQAGDGIRDYEVGGS